MACNFAGAGKEIGTPGEEQHMDGNDALPGDGRTRGLPHVLFRRGPREIVDAVRMEAPHQAAIGVAHGRGVPRTDLARTNDGGDRVGLRYRCQSLTGRCGEHLRGILQHPGATHDPACRYVDIDVEAAEVVVELRGTDVQLRVPSTQVIIHRHPREPLRGLVERIGPTLHHAMTGSGSSGQFVRPCNVEQRAGAGRNGRCQPNGGRRGAAVEEHRLTGQRVRRTLLCRHDRARSRPTITRRGGVGREIHRCPIDGHA